MGSLGLSIDHVEFFVPDRRAAAQWYQSVLGLEVVARYAEWAAVPGGPLMISCDGGTTKLALFEGNPQERRPTSGFHRVAFRTDSAGFLGFVARLPELALSDAEGSPVDVRSLVDHGQSFSLYFCDPYGHRLELTSYDHEAIRGAVSKMLRADDR